VAALALTAPAAAHSRSGVVVTSYRGVVGQPPAEVGVPRDKPLRLLSAHSTLQTMATRLYSGRPQRAHRMPARRGKTDLVLQALCPHTCP
jgi:hypothetical protein